MIIKFEGVKIIDETIRSTTAYLALYVFIFCVSLLIVSADKTDFVTNVTSVISAFNNIGPNLGPRLVDGATAGFGAGGPFSNFGSFSDLSKIVLTLDMLLGRLELFPIIVLFTPSKSLKQRISKRKGL